MLNRAKDYHKNDKERLKKKTYLKKKKIKKREYGKNRCRNMSK